MAAVGMKELKTHASTLLRALREGRVRGYVITSRGKPVARLLPINEDEVEELILSMDNPEFKKFIQGRRRQPSISWDELKSGVKLGKAKARIKKAS